MLKYNRIKIIQSKIRAAQAGTKRLTEKYGEKLICVRYIYNPVCHVKLKTVELLEDKQPWNPDKNVTPPNKMIHLKVEYGEFQN